MPQNNRPHNRPPARYQSGNAFALVMIGVVLFGALMYTFSRSARQGDSNLSQKKVEVVASDILAYAQRLERGVARVMTRGCSADFISFEHPSQPDYPANPEAPADKSCHVFDPAGGGVSPLPDNSFGLSVDIRPSGGAAVLGIGTDGVGASPHQDLVVWFSAIPKALCEELNRRSNYDGPVPAFAAVQAWEFGNYPIAAGEHWGASLFNPGPFAGRNAGCGHQPGTPPNTLHLAQGYNFYYVLHPR